MSHPFQFLFKPTYACNLACKYCYAQNLRKHIDIISDLDAQKLFQWSLDYSKRFGIDKAEILWHGGEPLLPGADFMRRTVEYYTELFEKAGIRCISRIQTNLLLMSDDYLPLIKKYFGNQMGFSFDYNSSDRCYSNGKNAENDIWSKALWTKEKGVNIGAICQISAGNANKLHEMYLQFKNACIPFNISRICDVEQSTGHYHNDFSDEAYIEAVCQLFDLWFEDPTPSIEIGTFKEWIGMLLCNNSNCCCFKKECNLLVFGPRGDIYPCDKFSDETQKLGNYFIDTPDKICEKRMDFSATIVKNDKHISECSSCEFIKMCHGGCLFDRLSGWRTHECKTNKAIWTYIAKRLKEHGLNRGDLEERTNEAY